MTPPNNVHLLRSHERALPSGVDGTGGGPHDPGMEARVAKLEAHSEHIRKGVDDIQSELREIRNLLGKHGVDTNNEFRAIRSERSAETWKILSAGGGVFVLLLGVLAKGFKWL